MLVPPKYGISLVLINVNVVSEVESYYFLAKYVGKPSLLHKPNMTPNTILTESCFDDLQVLFLHMVLLVVERLIPCM